MPDNTKMKPVKAWAVVSKGKLEIGMFTGRYTVHPDKEWCEKWTEIPESS